MSAEFKGEHPLGNEIDAIFEDGYGKTTKSRIALAAVAISAHVNHLDVLIEQRQKFHESVRSASRLDISLQAIGYSGLFAPIVPYESESMDKGGVEQILKLFEENDEDTASIFDPIEKAKLTLRASHDGIRAAYNLSRFQAYRAVNLSRKQTH
jgi:hypothetical protein